MVSSAETSERLKPVPIGIDKHQVGEIEPGAGIVGQLRRIGRAVSLFAELEVLGPDGAEIQIDRSRARAAIQRESHRPVLALHRVSGKDHFADLLAVVEDRQRAHRDRVVQRLAIELNALRHMRVRGQRSFLVGFIFVLVLYRQPRAAEEPPACFPARGRWKRPRPPSGRPACVLKMYPSRYDTVN